MKKSASIVLAVLISCLSMSAEARGQGVTDPRTGERRRIVPLYAYHKNGSPVTGLAAGDLEVDLNGVRVEHISLQKGGSPNKIVFLVFDAASQPYSILAKSKKIAEEVMSQAEGQARFVVMTIDPHSGLKVILGPSGDRHRAVRAVQKSVLAKKSDSLKSRAVAGTQIRDVYPQGWGSAPTRMQKAERDQDLQADKQLAAVIIQSLRTLNVILDRFPESSTVVHL
jgi:hypothetical protein